MAPVPNKVLLLPLQIVVGEADATTGGVIVFAVYVAVPEQP